jgi:hypothetical protein
MMLGTGRPVPSAFNGPFPIWGQTYARYSGAFVPQLLQACSDHRKNRRLRGDETQVLIWLMGFAVGSLEN